MQFTVANTGLCFKFSQQFHKQIPCLYSLNTANIVNLVASGYFLQLHLLQNGVIESNPEQGNEQINKNFSCYYWNVNGLLADNLAKIFQLEAFNSLFNYDFIWISEVLEHQSYDSSALE